MNKISCLKSVLLICIFGIGIVFISCDLEESDEINFKFDKETFMLNWNAWNDQNIKNYSFTLSRSYNFFRGLIPTDDRFDIIVKDGILYTFEYYGNYFDWQNKEPFPLFTSICDIYQHIYDSIPNSKQALENDPNLTIIYNIEYNKELFYITYFNNIAFLPDVQGWVRPPFRIINFKRLD